MGIERVITRFHSIQKDSGWKQAAGRVFLILARLCFGLTLISLPFRARVELLSREIYPVYRDYTNFLLFPSDITLILTLIFWSAAHLSLGRRPSTHPRLFTGLLAGFTLLSGLSVFWSVDPELSAYHTLRLALLFGFYLYLLNEIRDLSQVFWPVCIQLTIQAFVAIVQFLSQGSIGLQRFGEYSLQPSTAGASVILVNEDRILRAYGLSDHPNILAGCLAFGLILLAGGLLIRIRQIRDKNPGAYLPVMGVYSLGLLALFFTFSRSGWLALAVGWLFFLGVLWRTDRKADLSVWIGLSVLSFLVLSPFLLQNLGALGVRINPPGSAGILQSERRSLPERAALTHAANRIFSEAPLTGVGLGVFPTALRLAEPDFPFNFQPPHLVLLEIAAEIGLPAALGFSLLLAWPWLVLVPHRRKRELSITQMTAYAILLAISLVSFLDYYPWLYQPGRLWLWLGWGMWGAVSKAPRIGGVDA